MQVNYINLVSIKNIDFAEMTKQDNYLTKDMQVAVAMFGWILLVTLFLNWLKAVRRSLSIGSRIS